MNHARPLWVRAQARYENVIECGNLEVYAGDRRPFLSGASEPVHESGPGRVVEQRSGASAVEAESPGRILYLIFFVPRPAAKELLWK